MSSYIIDEIKTICKDEFQVLNERIKVLENENLKLQKEVQDMKTTGDIHVKHNLNDVTNDSIRQQKKRLILLPTSKCI